jgi:uncharacterized protein YvpB
MNLEVPFFSQLNNGIPDVFERQSCGICCVKMLLDYYNKEKNEKKIEILDLIKEGELIKAFDRQINNGVWVHDGLAKILRNHGIPAYVQEFRSVKVNLDTENFEENENQKDLLQIGIEKILLRLKKGYPVIASVEAGFGSNTSTHMIVISGYKKDDEVSFIINDPLEDSEKEISLEYFLEFWRKFVIFSQ